MALVGQDFLPLGYLHLEVVPNIHILFRTGNSFVALVDVFSLLESVYS